MTGDWIGFAVHAGTLVDTTAWTLLHFCWQAAMGALLYLGLCWLGARAGLLDAQGRYALGAGVLAALLVAPLLTFAWLQRDAAAPLLAPLQVLAELPAAVGGGAIADLAAPQSWTAWLVAVWICGVTVFCLRFAVGYRYWWRLRRHAAYLWDPDLLAMVGDLQLRLGLPAKVDVRLSRDIGSPAVVGFFRYTLLLPVSFFTGLSLAQAEAILAHELAHVKRRDGFVSLLLALAETLFFFHPAIWWLSREIRYDREKACDVMAATAIGSPAEYAEALLALDELRAAPRELVVAARRGSLEDRIRYLMEAESVRTTGGGFAMAALPLAVLLGGSLWAMSARVPLPAPGQLPPLASPDGKRMRAPGSPASGFQPGQQPSRAVPVAQGNPEPHDVAPASPASVKPASGIPMAVTVAQAQQAPAEANAQPKQPAKPVQLAAPAAEATPAGPRVRILSPQAAAKPAPLMAQPDPLRAATLAALAVKLEGSRFLNWVMEDVAYLIRDEELLALERLGSDAERDEFLRQFWLRRDPTPGTDNNEAKQEHYRRISYANERFGEGPVSGWRTEKGRVYIQFGPPDEIEARPEGYQRWFYQQIPGVGYNISFEFGQRPVGVF